MTSCQRSPSQWFAEAARCYIDNHQGCAWCGGSHRVFRTKHGTEQQYFCHGCDFRVVYDAAADRYLSFPGEEGAEKKPRTMQSDLKQPHHPQQQESAP